MEQRIRIGFGGWVMFTRTQRTLVTQISSISRIPENTRQLRSNISRITGNVEDFVVRLISTLQLLGSCLRICNSFSCVLVRRGAGAMFDKRVV